MDDYKDIISDINCYFYQLEDKVQSLLDILRDFDEKEEKRRRDATEECFDLLIKNGFNVGTKFSCEESVYSIVGINCSGFIIEREVDGEKRRSMFFMDEIQEVERLLPKLKIIREESK